MAHLRDFRKLSPEAQAEARRIAVEMVKAGKTKREAAATVGVNRRFVGDWVRAEAARGASALVGGKRGRRKDEQKALTPSGEFLIRNLVKDKCPDQLKLPFALWTREAVRDLVLQRTGLRLALTTIGNYLRAWGMTVQRPVRRATERSEPAVRAWLEHDYPKIVRRAKAENAEIQWADETGITNQANYGRSFAPKGETPVVPRTARKITQSMISALTNQGKLRFMIYEGALNVEKFIEFLRRLIKCADRKVFLIVDNLRVHHAELVTEFVAANAGRIELFFLPSYAPDRNPDEFLNNDLKQALGKRRTPRDKAGLKSGITSHMRRLQRRPEHVRSFFQAPSVRYAA
jgi:transposase